MKTYITNNDIMRALEVAEGEDENILKVAIDYDNQSPQRQAAVIIYNKLSQDYNLK